MSTFVIYRAVVRGGKVPVWGYRWKLVSKGVILASCGSEGFASADRARARLEGVRIVASTAMIESNEETTP